MTASANGPETSKPSATIRLCLAITTLSAACGLAVEIIAGRMIAPYLGMSLYTWTAIIAVVLAGFSLGHWIGGRIADMPPQKALRAVGFALVAAALTTAGSLVLLRIIAGPVLGLGLGPVAAILTITTALFFAPSLFVGIPSPVLTKLAIEQSPTRMGHTLGIFYAAGAIGSILGTLASGYLLIAWLGTITSLLVIASLYAAMGAILLWHARHGCDTSGTAETSSFPLVVAVLIAASIGGTGTVMGAFRPNCTAESQYYCIRVDDVTADVGMTARVLVLDHLAHGINVRDQPAALVSPYVAMQNALADTHLARPGSMRAFFVGGGAYTLPRAWAANHADARITVAELDPAVTATAREHMWLDASSRLDVHHLDARRALVESPTGAFDVVVGDAFHDIAVPPHLVTAEFFALIRSRLAEGGLYVMNVVDESARPRLTLSVVETLSSSFPIVELWAQSEDAETHRRATFVVAALPQPSPAAALTLGDGTTWVRWSAERIASLSRQTGAIKLTDDFAPVDRLIGVD